MAKPGEVAAGVAGGLLVALGALWLATAPDTVSRAEMTSYVEVTATEHLRILRVDFKEMSKSMSEVAQRLAAVEAVLRER